MFCSEVHWSLKLISAMPLLVPPDGPVIWRMLTYPPTRRALLVGCGLQMFQQLSGINTIMWVKSIFLNCRGSMCVTGQRLHLFLSLGINQNNDDTWYWICMSPGSPSNTKGAIQTDVFQFGSTVLNHKTFLSSFITQRSLGSRSLIALLPTSLFYSSLSFHLRRLCHPSSSHPPSEMNYIPGSVNNLWICAVA